MIRVVVGALEAQEVSGVVRPIRADLDPVDAQSRDLSTAAGPELGERLSRLGGIPLGGAVLTPGGGLPADFVIHAVVMSAEQPVTSATVQRALRNALGRAVDWGLESLALPAMGLGVGTMAAEEESARALVHLLFNHLDEGQPPLALTLVVGSEYEAELFGRIVDEATAARQPD